MRGTKTTIGVIVEPVNGMMSSRSALVTASMRFCPLSRCATIFSSTTMASSMTRPTAGGEAAECHEVKALTGGAENDERDQKGYGNDEPRDERSAPITKKENENHRRE